MNHIYNKKLKESPVFVIGDIHGCYRELKKLLEKKPKNAKVVFLGDYLDRGENSKKSLRIVMDLVEKGEATALMGNHEEMFLNYLNGELDAHIYFRNGGNTTNKDFLSEFKEDYLMYGSEANELFKKHYPKELGFIQSLPKYATMGANLFVHAGIHPSWTSEEDFMENYLLWIRKNFHYAYELKSKYRVFFGHTPVTSISEYTKGTIWKHIDGKRYGLDGGCVFGGSLFGVYLDPSKDFLEVYKVDKFEADSENEVTKLDNIFIH